MQAALFSIYICVLAFFCYSLIGVWAKLLVSLNGNYVNIVEAGQHSSPTRWFRTGMHGLCTVTDEIHGDKALE